MHSGAGSSLAAAAAAILLCGLLLLLPSLAYYAPSACVRACVRPERGSLAAAPYIKCADCSETVSKCSLLSIHSQPSPSRPTVCRVQSRFTNLLQHHLQQQQQNVRKGKGFTFFRRIGARGAVKRRVERSRESCPSDSAAHSFRECLHAVCVCASVSLGLPLIRADTNESCTLGWSLS